MSKNFKVGQIFIVWVISRIQTFIKLKYGVLKIYIHSCILLSSNLYSCSSSAQELKLHTYEKLWDWIDTVHIKFCEINFCALNVYETL